MVLISECCSFNLCFINPESNGAFGLKQKGMSFPFTMQQFLIAAAVLSLVWYAGVFLWFNQRRGIGLQIGKSRLRPSLPGRGAVALEEEGFEEHELMAKVKLPEGMELLAAENLRFAGTLDGIEGAAANQSDQLGLIPDVLEEIKEVFGILAKEDGTKQDFLRLMKLVREKYPRISSHPGLAGLNAFIRDHASFHLSNEELEGLWD